MDSDKQRGGPGYWPEPDPDRRCVAKSKQSGQRCRRYREPGMTVCRIHGGGSPQVKRKAALRLLELVDPAISVMARIMVDQTASEAARLRAAENVLDRAGVPRQIEALPGDVAREVLTERLIAMRAEQAMQEGDASTVTVVGELAAPDEQVG